MFTTEWGQDNFKDRLFLTYTVFEKCFRNTLFMFFF